MLEKLNNARSKWYFIGKGIGCKIDDLDEIQGMHLHNNAMCLGAMLVKRIQAGELTRFKLCESLRGIMVQRDDVAQEIEALNLL